MSSLLVLQETALPLESTLPRQVLRDLERPEVSTLLVTKGEITDVGEAALEVDPELDGLTSEALSKTVFVLGVEQGLRIVESVPGADAVVIDASGQLHSSSGLLVGGRPRHAS